jgi:hypothetical protein
MASIDYSAADYDSVEAVHYSTLKWMRRSPLHYWHHCDTPSADNDAFRLGRATHAAVFEPDRFLTDFVAWDRVTAAGNPSPRNGKAWNGFQEEHAGKTILPLEQMQQATAIGDAVRSHPVAQRILFDPHGKAEEPLYWTDSTTGLLCKARLDWIAPAMGDIADLKTDGMGINAWRFARTMDALGYYLQAAFYRRALLETRQMDFTPVLIVVEKQPPHDVAVWEVGAQTLEVADAEIDELFEQISSSMARDSWPGAFPERGIIDLPSYRLNTETADFESLGLEP